MKSSKICWILTHPIQYQTPLLQEIAKIKNINFEVIYFYEFLNKSFFDKDFNRNINWDINLTNKYKFFFLLNKNFLFLNVFIIFFKIFFLFKKKKYDFIIIQGWNDINYIISLFIGKYFGSKVILRSEGNSQKKINKLKFFFKNFFLKLIFSKINYFAAIGSLNKKFYLKNGVKKNKIFMMPYCVDNNFFRKIDAKYMYFLKKKYAIKKQDKIILFAGKLIPRKSPITLLKAFSLLKKKNVHLIFVGDGILKTSLHEIVLQKKIKRVYFFGFLGQKKLSTIYNMSDIFVLVSKEETWGLVVNEALAGSCAVIVSKQVGSGIDLVKNNYNGFVLNKTNEFSLNNYLNKLLSSKKLSQMKKNSRKSIIRFSIKENIKNLKLIFKNGR